MVSNQGYIPRFTVGTLSVVIISPRFSELLSSMIAARIVCSCYLHGVVDTGCSCREREVVAIRSRGEAVLQVKECKGKWGGRGGGFRRGGGISLGG